MITSSGRTKIAQRWLCPPHARHAYDFATRLKSKKLHKRLLRDITPDDVDAPLHQQPNGRCAGPGQRFPGKLEVALLAVAFCDQKMVPPLLFFSFPLKVELMRPGHGVDAILCDAHPTARECAAKPPPLS